MCGNIFFLDKNLHQHLPGPSERAEHSIDHTEASPGYWLYKPLLRVPAW